jgi:hypothetical protein
MVVSVGTKINHGNNNFYHFYFRTINVEPSELDLNVFIKRDVQYADDKTNTGDIRVPVQMTVCQFVPSSIPPVVNPTKNGNSAVTFDHNEDTADVLPPVSTVCCSPNAVMTTMITNNEQRPIIFVASKFPNVI